MTQFAKLCTACRLEAHHIGAGGADPERERLPPILEVVVGDFDCQLARHDIAESCCFEEFGEMALAGSREARFALRCGVELVYRFPEQTERATTAVVVPHARRDDATRPCDPGHLSEPNDRINHEMHDQVRERRIECGALERKMLGGRRSHRDAGEALSHRGNERIGWLHGRNVRGTDSPHKLRRQRPRAATNIEYLSRDRQPSKINEGRREHRRVPAHKPVVRQRINSEAHDT